MLVGVSWPRAEALWSHRRIAGPLRGDHRADGE